MDTPIDLPENKRRMLSGELYHAFTPDLVLERQRCAQACQRFNTTVGTSRRQLVEMWRDIIDDHTPLPCVNPDPAKDDELFAEDPWVEPPFRIDYGTHFKLGQGVYINAGCHVIDTCLVEIGARTLIGPNVSFFSGTHPLDPCIRQGTKGPELGKEIHIGEDVWIGGGAIILPGVTVGKGCTIGAGSVVTKDVLPFHVVAGNPARIIRKIKTKMDPSQQEE